MKLDPIKFLVNKNFEIDKKIYFISGNEITLIEKIKLKIIKSFQKREKVIVLRIDSIDNFADEEELFQNKKIYLVKNYKYIDKKSLSIIKEKNCIFVFVQENSQKIKKVKNELIKDKDVILFDCYELDQNSKITILNEFLKLNRLVIDQSVYWLLVEKLDNKYGLFENTLSKILELDQNDINFNNIKKIITINEAGKEKIFFYLLKRNSKIVEIYREKIVTISDVNDFFYYCKFFCKIIIESNNENEYNKKIPIYLFKEKKYLIGIYRRYNWEKKKLLLNLILSTEKILRKENSLSLIFGLRFFLNIKKITVS